MIRRLLAAGLIVGACSTIALDDVVRCVKNEDCMADQLCSGGECYPNTLPDPPGQIGLDVAVDVPEGTLHVELTGSDKTVERILNQYPTRFRVQFGNGPKPPANSGEKQTPGARDRLSITIGETYVQGETKQRYVPASLALEQTSRLRRNPVTGEGTYVPYAADGETLLLNAEVELPWARYDPADTDFPLVLTIRGAEGMEYNDKIVRAPVHRQLVRKELGIAATHPFAISTRRECHRKLVGNIVVGDGAPLAAKVNVEFLHARSTPDPGKSVCDPSTDVQAVCEPSTIAVSNDASNQLPPCTSANDCPAPYGCYPEGSAKRCGCSRDSECLTGQICELASHRCALDLTGRSATNAVATGDGSSTFDAWVYTYCDDDIEADREMAFSLRTTPVGLDDDDPMTPLPLSRLPQLEFDAAVNIPASDDATLKLPGNLCFPDWQAPISLTLAVNHEPRELYRDEMDRPWSCCTTECLATKQVDPPVAPTTCPLTSVLTARTRYVQDHDYQVAHTCLALTATNPDEPNTQWIDSGRVQLGACVDPGGNPAACTIPLSPGGLDEASRTYELRLEPPVGSIVRSTTYDAEVADTSMSLPAPATLEYRVLLRGHVALSVDPASKDEVCADLTQCLVKAEVLAERIRVPGEDPRSELGPFFYTTRTIEGSDTGEFVLPVNPGVYLLTALPAISSPGGPAKISVVDLRIGSKLVKTTGKIPTADLEDPLLLPQLGQFVIFELADFDFASVATPFDLGGWDGLEFEGQALDLNDVATCYGDPGRACAIRRLRAGNSGLALTQEQFVKFVTRQAR